MFGKIAGFEFRYQIRQPIFWIVMMVCFLMTFGSVTVDQIRIGDLGPNDFRNGPFAQIQTMLFVAVFYMFVTTAFVANVVVRDDDTGFSAIIRTTRVRKFDYLYGRFLGAFAAAALSFVAVPAAILAGSLMPWVDRELIGPFVAAHYLYAYFVVALPPLFLTSTVFFALATLTRSMMWTYVGVIGFLVLWLVATLTFAKPELDHITAIWEPFGVGAFSDATKYWTANERNHLLPPLVGPALWNKALWLTVSGAALALAYVIFRFDDVRLSGRRRKAAKLAALAEPRPAAVPLGRLPRPRFNLATTATQVWARARLDMAQVFFSPAYGVMLAFGLFNVLTELWVSVDMAAYGGAVHPVTRMMIAALGTSFTFFALIIAVFYAGELVWRERDKGTSELIDVTATPTWAFVLPKILAIALVLVSTLGVSVVAAVGLQAVKGYFHFELGKYLVWYVLPQAVDFLLIAVLAVFIQALSPHKFFGWGLMILFVISLFVLPGLGLEHRLYRYAGSPPIPLSDMNGQGRFWIGAAWFQVYWSAFAVVLTVLAYGLWPRGMETRLRPRLRVLPRRLAGPSGMVGGAALAAMAAVGVFIFVNTNIWNEYRTVQDNERWQADMEKALLPFENRPQPTVTAVKLDVDIRPRQPRIVTKGVYVIENRTGAPLREIHLRFDRGLDVSALTVQGAWPKKTYDRFNYRIFAFDMPMLPGEKRTLSFQTERAQKGFVNGRPWLRVVDNGTFIDDSEIAPALGMDRNGLLQDRTKRRKYGLPAELRMAPLGDPAMRAYNYLRHDSDWVDADITVTTDADQTPIAPGARVSETVKGGRRTARFVSDAPIMHGFSLQSARYAVRRETYKGVDLAVHYHPAHAWNVPRMIDAAKAALDYCSANFSPYQFRQLRFVEFPVTAGEFAQSFANTVPWSEGMGFIADYKDPEKIDMVTYVGAHEIAHQWWAHQVVGADEQGATMLSETLAQYSALMVMKRLYGPDMIRKFLKYELDGYLRARGGEAIEELPLDRVENQPYIHYRKGSLVMYRLADEIGEEAVNRALRKFLDAYAFKGAPYPTSADLVALLRAEAPADKQQLITDLFDKITLYDLRASRARVARRPDGRFDVAVTVVARKLYADGRGKEVEAPLSEAIDIGVFDAEPGKKAFSKRNVLALQRQVLHSGEQTVVVTVDHPPRFAGVDPYNKLIDRNSNDNVIRTD